VVFKVPAGYMATRVMSEKGQRTRGWASQDQQ